MLLHVTLEAHGTKKFLQEVEDALDTWPEVLFKNKEDDAKDRLGRIGADLGEKT